MRTRTIIVTTLVSMLLAVGGSVALAARGGVPGPPGTTQPPEPTTTTEPTLWTCAARVDNGAIWVPGGWDGASYVAGGLPTCIDIESDHTVAHRWRVVWNGTLAKASATAAKGLLLRFETGVHGDVWAEEEFTTISGCWATEAIDPADDAFVFVAMPHNGDRWTSFQVTVTPFPADALGDLCSAP